MTRNKVVPSTGTAQGISHWRPLAADYAKPIRGTASTDHLALAASMVNEVAQLDFGRRRDDIQRQAQTLAQLLDEFRSDLELSEMLPSEDMRDARARAWGAFVNGIRSARLSDFIVAAAQQLDAEVRP
jgi:hypothetical protein